jgi:hypothetical protein
MIDCYKVLGISPDAGPVEIRAAYIIKMKAIHPDARPAARADGPEAGEVTYAYWCLRDPGRRVAHDRALLGTPAPVSPRQFRKATPPTTHGRSRRLPRDPVKPPARAVSQAGTRRSRLRLSRGLQPLRTAIGFTWFVGALILSAGLYAHWAGREEAAAPARAGQALWVGRDLEKHERRGLQPAAIEIATENHRRVLVDHGAEAVRLYARQCLLELTVRQNMTLLDSCVAFDDAAAAWESAQASLGPASSYFDDGSRFDRYVSTAKSLKSPLREVLLSEAFSILPDQGERHPGANRSDIGPITAETR